MFYDQVLQDSYSQLSDVWIPLQALGYLSQEQTHQEMVLAVVLSKAVLQTLVWKKCYSVYLYYQCYNQNQQHVHVTVKLVKLSDKQQVFQALSLYVEQIFTNEKNIRQRTTDLPSAVKTQTIEFDRDCEIRAPD